MKKLLIPICRTISLTVSVPSCTVDKCKSMTCQNGGVCGDGICSCPSGWTGNYCQSQVTGTIQFVNNSENPYKVYIDNTYKTSLLGCTTVTYNIAYGSHTCRVIQESGYLVSPTDETFTGVVSTSKNMVISFP